MSPPRRVLCIISEKQQAEYQTELDFLKRNNVELAIERSPESSLPKLREISPVMIILGTQIEDYEGLEIMSMILRQYKDFSRPIVVLPEKEDGIPPMIHSRAPETGRSSVQSAGFETIAEIIRNSAEDQESILPAEPPPSPGGKLPGAQKLFDASEISEAIEAEAINVPVQTGISVEVSPDAAPLAAALVKKGRLALVIAAAVIVVVIIAVVVALSGKEQKTEAGGAPTSAAAQIPKPAAERAPAAPVKEEPAAQSSTEAPKQVDTPKEEPKPAGDTAAEDKTATKQAPEPPRELSLPIAFGKGGISPRIPNEKKLNDVIDSIKGQSWSRMELTGHASSEGESDDNFQLARLRAENAKKILVNRGLDTNKIEVKAPEPPSR